MAALIAACDGHCDGWTGDAKSTWASAARSSWSGIGVSMASRSIRPHRLAAMLAVTAALTAVWAAPAASASVRRHHHHSRHRAHASAPPSHPGWAKYYVVAPPKNGYKELLYEIVAKTLGNGDRDTAIFNLNKGRLQPDGGRLENPTVIDPGWILVLPSNASGPGVHYGPLPVVILAPAASASATPAATRRSLAAAIAHQSRPGTPYAMIVGAAVLIVLLLAAGLAIFLMRRRKAGAAAQPGPGTVSLPPAPGPQAEVAGSTPVQPAGDGPGDSLAGWAGTWAAA